MKLCQIHWNTHRWACERIDKDKDIHSSNISTSRVSVSFWFFRSLLKLLSWFLFPYPIPSHGPPWTSRCSTTGQDSNWMALLSSPARVFGAPWVFPMGCTTLFRSTSSVSWLLAHTLRSRPDLCCSFFKKQTPTLAFGYTFARHTGGKKTVPHMHCNLSENVIFFVSAIAAHVCST